jgi:hypothetical protein
MRDQVRSQIRNPAVDQVSGQGWGKSHEII